jgi:hypothetical protein
MSTMVRRLVIGAVSALVAATGSTTPAAPLRTTAGPAACAPAAVAVVISDFFADVNRGDGAAAVAIMDPQAGPRNQRPRGWYSLSEGNPRGVHRHHAFYRRATLARYLIRRHRHGEHLHLRAVLVGARNGRADFELRVERHARDLRAGGITKNRIAHGKGALFCGRRKIFVMSLAHPPVRALGAPICPGDTIACARR